MTRFGDHLRSFRQAKGLSLDDLASATGVSRAYLWKLERKPDANPSLEILQKLADALGTTVGDLAAIAEAAAEPVAAPESLLAAKERFGLSDREVADLAPIRFRGGHPTTAEDWYALFLQLKRITGADRT